MNETPKIIEQLKKTRMKQYDIKKDIFDVKADHMPYLKGCPVADSSLIIFDVPQWIHENVPKWDLLQNDAGNGIIKPLPDVVYKNMNTNGHLWMYSLSSSFNKLKVSSLVSIKCLDI